MASNNLFKQLYSRDNSKQQSGFICSNAGNIDDTSFDISGNNGVITDSNGNELAKIPLSLIHAAGITQYNTETRILQPHSCYVLQGQEFGLALTTYYYHLPEALASVENWDLYTHLDFDMVYNQYDHKHIHVSAPATGVNDFITVVNDCFEQNDIDVTLSIQDFKNPKDKKTYSYLVFQGGTEGYFFFVKNVKMEAAMQSEEYLESPFTDEVESVRLIVFNLINKWKPLLPDDEGVEEYSVDCKLYEWFVMNNEGIIEYERTFKRHIEITHLIDELYYKIDAIEYPKEDDIIPEDPDSIIAEYRDKITAYEFELKEILADTPYDDDVVLRYDYVNREQIYNIVCDMILAFEAVKNEQNGIHWLDECDEMRIPTMKYPNGALRGIVLIPEFPDAEEYEFSSLLVNHIQTTVNVYHKVKRHGHHGCETFYVKDKFGVMSSVMFKQEAKHCSNNPHNGSHIKFQSNRQLKTDILDGWDNAEFTVDDSEVSDSPNADLNWHVYSGCHSHQKPDDCQHDGYTYDQDHYCGKNDIVYLGDSCYSDKTKIMGLYRYMEHVSENDLWIKIGECYMAIAKEDNPQSHIYNLLSSVMVYNPNDIPVRVHYLIFS